MTNEVELGLWTHRKIFRLRNFICHRCIINQKIMHKTPLWEKFGFDFFYQLFAAYDLNFFKFTWVYNFKITLVVLIFPVNRKVYIFNFHGQGVS